MGEGGEEETEEGAGVEGLEEEHKEEWRTLTVQAVVLRVIPLRHLLLTNAQSVVFLKMELILGLPAILAIAGTTSTALV